MSSTQYLPLIKTELTHFLERFPIPEVVSASNTGNATARADTYDGAAIEQIDAQRIYTSSPWYLQYTTEFHDDLEVSAFIDLLLHNALPETSFVDVGCETGITGLCLGLAGHHVTFHDYEGVGLDFIRYFLGQHPEIIAKVIPYGLYVPRHTVAVALDVLEHTASHTGTLRWLRDLGDYVALTYPLRPFYPPYENHLDQYVDDEAVITIAKQRYEIGFNVLANQRRFLVYT